VQKTTQVGKRLPQDSYFCEETFTWFLNYMALIDFVLVFTAVWSPSTLAVQIFTNNSLIVRYETALHRSSGLALEANWTLV
jgi:hypothetical protein